MNKIQRQLRAADPVRIAELEVVSSHSVFDALFEEIVDDSFGIPSEVTTSDEAGIERGECILGGGHGRNHGRRRPLVAAIAGVAVLLLVVGGLVMQPLGHARQPGSRTATTRAKATTGPVSAPKWRLVSDIDSSWRTVSGLGYEPGLFLTCPTTSTCYVDNLQQGAPGTYSEIEVTNDSGNTWRSSDLPVTLSDATPLACVNADTCATLGLDTSGGAVFLETQDGGDTWADVAGPSQLTSTAGVTSLACTSAQSCIAVVSDPTGQSGAALAFVTNDGGGRWTDSNLPTDFVPGGLRGIQCFSAESCDVVGFYQSPDGSTGIPPGTVLYTSDDGATWATATVPPGLGPLSAVSCADPTDCVASFFGDDGSSSEILTSTDGGRSWSEATGSGLPAAMVTGLSCPAASECWAGGITCASGGSGGSGPIAVKLGPGAQGIVASTADGAQTWQTQQLPQGVLIVLDIACPSDTSCYALALQSPSSGSPASFVLLAYGS